MSERTTRGALHELSAPLLRRMAVGGITLVAGALLVVLAAAAWLARLGVVHTLWWVPAAWVVAVAVSATAVRLASRRFRSLGAFSLARYLEAGAAGGSGRSLACSPRRRRA